MAESRRVRAEPWLIGTVVLLGIAFAANALHLSAYWGILAIPPTYDDVGYLLSGFDLFEAGRTSSVGALLAELLHHHAPLQSAVAFVGYRLFGVNQWAAYQVNGVLLVAFTLGVLWLTRSLGAMSRLSLLVIVLATPFTTNLVTEFRPDLFWGLLCGFAVLVLLHPNLLDPDSTARRYGAAILAAAALHAKPSASPATALLLAVALVLGLWLRTAYRPLPLRDMAIRLVLPLGVVLLISAPYFALNARRLYDYIQLAFVTWREVNQFKGSLTEHATFYSIGACYRTALFTTLWVGLAAFLMNAARLRRRRLDQDLAYHLALVGMVVLAYLIPTLSGVKSYFLGGIFYGTFLIATIASITTLLHDLDARHESPAHHMRWALPIVATVIVLTAPSVPLVNAWDHRFTVEIRAVYRQMMDAIAADTARSTSAGREVVVYTPSPFIMNAHAITLLSRWKGAPIVGLEGYYPRTMSEQRANLERSDYVILSELNDSVYPGSALAPALLALVRSDPDFEKISDFEHADGLHTFLFRHRRGATRPPS